MAISKFQLGIIKFCKDKHDFYLLIVNQLRLGDFFVSRFIDRLNEFSYNSFINKMVVI